MTTWIPIAKFHDNNIRFILWHHFHPFSAPSDLGLEAGAGVRSSSMENPGSLGAFSCRETWGNLVDTRWLVRGAHPSWEGAFSTSRLESSVILFQSHLPTARASDFLEFFFCVHIGVG